MEKNKIKMSILINKMYSKKNNLDIINYTLFWKYKKKSFLQYGIERSEILKAFSLYKS